MKKLQYSEPFLVGRERAKSAKAYRKLAAELADQRPHAVTRTNGEEADYGCKYPANFTKGLEHDSNGIVKDPESYAAFVEAINSEDSGLFDTAPPAPLNPKFNCKVPKKCKPEELCKPEWRGWESPRAGHAFDLEGPDAGALGMAPAPRVGSCELALEMAEVYGLALLRDVPFSKISAGTDSTANEIIKDIGSIPCCEHTDEKEQERCTCTPWAVRPRPAFNNQQAFRGSTKGARVGPYISQFLLVGTPSRDGEFDFSDGYIEYGSVRIDQRNRVHKEEIDYMTDWCSWLDVQNGAKFQGTDLFENEPRFITTLRDLATYVHFDALYQAYLNATLILLGIEAPASKGFPEPSRMGQRDAFATFGVPHILTLVTEVATRCLKAVRRQKFNYHRRARPEAIGGRLTLACLDHKEKEKEEKEEEEKEKALGCSYSEFEKTLEKIPERLRKMIIAHNQTQNSAAKKKERLIKCGAGVLPDSVTQGQLDDCNLLLPMAFPEGSPMHPSYGAGHATVAGGCVTMLKAFFEMFEDCNGFVERKLVDKKGNAIAYEPNPVPIKGQPKKPIKGQPKRPIEKQPKGTVLQEIESLVLTIQGELDKLAANISIGRNMAGVHYYSDYYDSLRMGERVAVGILMEQAAAYNDYTEVTFKSFDGDMMIISCQNGGTAELTVLGKDGKAVNAQDWWLRHTS